MDIRNNYVCPHCGSSGGISDINVLFSDVKYEEIVCDSCGAKWKAYYKISDTSIEIISIPETSEEVASEEKSE